MAQAQLPQWTIGSMTYRELSLALCIGVSGTSCCLAEKMCPKCGTDMRLVKRKGANPESMGWQKGMRWPCNQGRFLRAATYLFHKSSP